jgi:hypothetical protein
MKHCKTISACSIFFIGVEIARTWTPVAMSCGDKTLRDDLMASLLRVGTLSETLKAVIGARQGQQDVEAKIGSNRCRFGGLVCVEGSSIDSTCASEDIQSNLNIISF